MFGIYRSPGEPAADPAYTSLPEPAAPTDIIDARALSAALSGLADDLGAMDERLAPAVQEQMRKVLQAGRAEVHRRFLTTPRDGRACVREQRYLTDVVVTALADLAAYRMRSVAPSKSLPRISILAVGGYGRGLMAPHSDVDLLILLAGSDRKRAERLVELLLYPLWDTGLKVGHAVRTVDECLKAAKADLTIRTNMLEMRPLWGDAALGHELRRRFQRDIVRNSGPDFVEAKLAERDERHKRWGDSRYVLEPNIKEGKGGLRDLQTLLWIGRYLYPIQSVSGLAEVGVLTAEEAKQFNKAENHLWTLRCHLHYQARRPEERLTFDLQKPIANSLEYVDRQGVLAVERFMKHYFLTAKEVGDLTRIVCASLEAENQRPPRRPLRWFGNRAGTTTVDGFVLEGERLSVVDADHFDRHPADIIRLFRVAQRENLDLHPHALKLIRRSQSKIRGLARNPEANSLFLEILTARENPQSALKRMTQAGVLGKFIHDFGRIVAQMQYDMYHVYTVDEHTLIAVGLLHKIETGAAKDRFPLAHELFTKIHHRRAIYVAMFCHDIAKGRGGDHSELGIGVVRRIGARLGLDSDEIEVAAWLVEHHLLMSRVAMNRDLEDDKTVGDFVATMATRERLRLLLILTTADIAAVGPGRWNGWKASLLSQLYHRALDLMSFGADRNDEPARVATAQDAVKPLLADWPQDQIDAFLATGTPSYWLSLAPEIQARHARLLREAEDMPLLVDTRIDVTGAVTEVTVITADQQGLFAQLCGALAMVGATIVDAKIYTMNDGRALDVFTVQDAATETALDQPDKLAKLYATIERSLSGEIDLPSQLPHRRSVHPPRARVFRVAPEVFTENDVSASHTVIEIVGRDRPGLLYDVAEALTSQGIKIASAKISTYGVRAVDVFYVKDSYGLKILHPAKLDQMRDRLTAALVRQGREAAE